MRMIPILAAPSAMSQDTLTMTAPCPELAIGEPHRPGCLTLADVPKGTIARVRSVRASSDDCDDLDLRLLEIGFVEGESLRVVAHGYPGGDPIAVRIGGTTFALRRFEARRILVTIDGPRSKSR